MAVASCLEDRSLEANLVEVVEVVGAASLSTRYSYWYVVYNAAEPHAWTCEMSSRGPGDPVVRFGGWRSLC